MPAGIWFGGPSHPDADRPAGYRASEGPPWPDEAVLAGRGSAANLAG
ncbi:hypothetical protein [Azospirillum largimobile]